MHLIPTPGISLIPPEVTALARKYNVDQYLEALCEATLGLFPTARGLSLFLEDDPEIPDFTSLVIQVRVPARDIPNYVAANYRWYDEYHRIVPPPYQCPLVFDLTTVDE